MAVPKKRTGASAQGHRRANWKATVPETTLCKNCNGLTLTHTVCPECGYYKNAAVSIKNENYVPLESVKKPAKKAAAKKPAKAKKEETPKKVEEIKEIEETVEVTEATEVAETTEAVEAVEEKE